MALNKFMHPRNMYKTPPDFEKLSKLYAEFSNIARVDVTGKVAIDFKNPHALRVLTKCLLKSDFNLDVEIPEDRLVPTLPLRLNYILWIEDLMAGIQRDSNICGIDIGTGACAIYPLLAAVKNKWHMLATEVDAISLQKAEENIHRNDLQTLIALKNNNGSTLIECLFAEENAKKYDFCMCNPPFYSNLQELCESRSPARLPPKNGFTGSPQELITDGGELKFCRKLIDESKRCKDDVLIFTTMVGHKYNLSELLQDLKADGIKHTHTEFCQGRVTRWGLAWTYQDHNISQLVPPRDKQRKKSIPITHTLPTIPNFDYSVKTAYNKIKTLLSELKIEQRILNKCKNRISLDIVANENTWSNQRRKRRLMKRIETTDPKKLKTDEASNNERTDKIGIEYSSKVEINKGKTDEQRAVENNYKHLKSHGDEINKGETGKEITIENSLKRFHSDEDENEINRNETGEKMLVENSSKQLQYDGDKVNNGETSMRSKVENSSKRLKSDKDTTNKAEISKHRPVENCSKRVKTDENEINKHETSTHIPVDNNSKLLKSDGHPTNNCETSENNPIENRSTQCFEYSKIKSDEVNCEISKKRPLYTHEAVNIEQSNNSNIDNKDGTLPQPTGSTLNEPLLHAFMKLYTKEDTIQLDVEFLDGTGGKESVHQVLQYIKNNWK